MKFHLFRKRTQLTLALSAMISGAFAQPLSEKLATTVMRVWPDSASMPAKWSYDHGVMLEGVDAVWKNTADGKYFAYMQKSMDAYVGADGSIRSYKAEDYNIDNVKNGRTLLTLYKVTGQKKYFNAATLLWNQLKKQPRTNEGGFWHKKIYPNQMWLDGLYMGEPFYAEYAAYIHEDKAFDDIANQFIWMEKHSRDPKTGLLYHGWDELKEQQWANKTTGMSPNFWGRAMGWYGMAIVDVLDYFPADHPKRAELLAILNRFAAAVKTVQDTKSGLWYDLLNMPNLKGNYHEASASAMFVYALAKGVRNGYLPASYLSVANKGFNGIKKEFIKTDASGQTDFEGTVSVSGLGGKPYRDGSVAYYLKEKVVSNDGKGLGAAIVAAAEMELAAAPKPGAGKTVLLDNYFNNEFYKEPLTGNTEPFHYLWHERDNNGFQLLGSFFTRIGAKLETLKGAPTAATLKNASIYIIVDPDSKKETENPNYVQPENIKPIADWVKNGGVLLLMGNDSLNCELPHFNKLAETFGIHFDQTKITNHVVGNDFAAGTIDIAPGNDIFKETRKVYLKDIAALELKKPAKPMLTSKGNVIVASAKYGKGTVLAVGDPWLYNEYTDGRRDHDYDNSKAAKEITLWLVKQVPLKK
ncbi:glycoside hydrolase family 88 protein [Pedobacter sp. HMF7647]|uniref:Glycoside hydrolase family 88 protein n=1 Tax=Hufsiella arboris TaxID=2695275 RepID=A0A7K1Y4J6_9SPHI|nr:glycoside hydrolase family 88 protein [Hufsiella arboris]MXV49484.1 glycoside hydrolase family 88 protein [Hufsiella arboris]